MIWLSDYLKNEYGFSLKKISIDAGFTCPNRDGKIGYGGCIFCSEKGSGDFTKGSGFSVEEQINCGKKEIFGEDSNTEKYIAYFQAYTNTYGDIEKMREMYLSVAKREDIAVISIATRPDCLGDEVILMLKELAAIKPLWVELGLQTIHETTADYIRRGYKLSVYDDAVRKLYEIKVKQVITHVILGLPGETREMMCDTVKYVSKIAKSYDEIRFGIKLQLLHVLKDTDLAKDYEAGKFECLSFDEYIDTVTQCIKIIPDKMVVHRITGDGDREMLIAPLWSLDKKKVINAIHQKVMQLSIDYQDTPFVKSINGISYSYYENISNVKKEKVLPVFVYGTQEDITGHAGKLFQDVKEKVSSDFVIVEMSVTDWDSDFSPWQAEGVIGDREFAGNGKKTLGFLTEILIPEIRKRYSQIGRDCRIITVGYSLAGLFSLWAYYESPSVINGAVCCSGSLWFPGYSEYMEQKSGIERDAKRKDIVYLSLGGKESSSGNPIMDKVGEITKRQMEIIKKDDSIEKCRYDINKGGHFADSVKRISKGITWCMSII